MPSMRYHADTAIIIGGSDVDEALLQSWSRELGVEIFAADGGLQHCVNAGLDCRAVFGDMDSVSPELQSRLKHKTAWHAIDEQDTTDLEKLLINLDARSVLGFGFMDGRFDHALQVMSVMARYQPTHHIVMVGAEDCLMLCRGGLSMQTCPDCRISIWPLAEISGMSSTGLAWPLDGLILSPVSQTGCSNRTTGTELNITMPATQTAPYAVIMPVEMTGNMLAASIGNR